MVTVPARAIAERVVDPELPMLTLADLGVLRDVTEDDGRVVVSITPTYSGCPAMDAMRDDLVRTLHAEGYTDVDVRVELDPPWTTDAITADGRRKLAAAGIAPPSRGVRCPRCDSPDTEELSRFSATACKALWRCRACAEPFERIKVLSCSTP